MPAADQRRGGTVGGHAHNINIKSISKDRNETANAVFFRGGTHGETIRESVLQFESMATMPERIRKAAALFMRGLFTPWNISAGRDRSPYYRDRPSNDRTTGDRVEPGQPRIIMPGLSLSRAWFTRRARTLDGNQRGKAGNARRI